MKHATYIKRYFDALYAEEIIKRLRTDESSIVWAGETLKALEKKSPTSIKVTLAALQRAKDMTIEEVYAMDLRYRNECLWKKVERSPDDFLLQSRLSIYEEPRLC